MNAPEPFDIEKLFNRIHQLEIHTPQGVSGKLLKESRYVFNYNQVDDDAAVSLVMPVRGESYASGDLMGVFAMNRPEGYLRYIIDERLKRLGAPGDMFLLFLAGGNQIGRLTYVLPGVGLPESKGELLENLLSSPSGALFERLVDQYAMGSGISGVQPNVDPYVKTILN
jgi:serine/threonine-protein kinase HipA